MHWTIPETDKDLKENLSTVKKVDKLTIAPGKYWQIKPKLLQGYDRDC